MKLYSGKEMSITSTSAVVLAVHLCWASVGLGQPVNPPPGSSGTAPGGGDSSPPPGATPSEAEPEPTLVKPPKLKELIQADIPKGTVFPGPEVVVVLEIDVAEDGRVTGVRVIEKVGEPFDGAAIKAAEQFEFEPALLSNGEQVPVTVTFRMRFSEPPPPPPPPVQFGGRLLERGSRKPLSGVEVVVQDPDSRQSLSTTATDDDGRFQLVVQAARFLVVAQPAGHERLEATVQASAGEEREEIFYLESAGGRFETVVRAERVRREVTKQVIPKALVDKMPGTQGDTLKVVQNLPGTARAAFGGGQLILRGASPGDSRIFLEGQEIPVLYHFGALRSTFNSGLLEAVEFIPGNFGPEYGRAMGGVINVKVRDPADDLFRGEVDLNLYDAGFLLEGPLSEDWSMAGAFHRSWVDTFISAVIPEDAGLSFNTAPAFYDYQLLTTWAPDANKKLKILWYGSLDRLKLLFERPTGDPKIRGALSARIMFHNLQASYFQRLSASLSQLSSIQFGFQELSTELGPEIFFDLAVWRVSFRTSWNWEALSWLDLRVGLDMRSDWVSLKANSSLRPIEGEQSPPISTQEVFGVNEKTSLFEPGAFVELAFKPTDDLTIVPSLRLDYYRNIGRWTFDPRLVARYQVMSGTVLKGGMGFYHQPPTPDQVVEKIGNPDLLAPRSTHSSLGIEQTVIEGLTVELTGFYKWLDRQVVRNPTFFADPSAVPYINGGTGRIVGLELLVKAQLGDFQGWLAYTYQRSFRKDGPNANERPFDFDQPHILTLVGSYEFGWGITAGLRFQLVSGNPSTPVLGSIYDANSDTWVPLFGATNSDRLPVFHQLDVRVDKTFLFDRWKLSAYLEVLNVYNQANAEGWQFNYDYSERSKLTGLPILPILGVKGEW